MSLILEALKKSEQQRRLGEAPNIGSPTVTTRRRRSFLPVIAILIVIAAAAAWWLSHRAAQPPAPAPVAANGAPTAAPSPLAGQVQVRPPAANRAQTRAAPRTMPKADQEKHAAAAGDATHATPPVTPPDSAALPTKPAATAGQRAPVVLDKTAGLHAPAPTAATPPKAEASDDSATAPKKPESAGTATAPDTANPAATAPDAKATAATAPDAKAAATSAPTTPAAAGSALPSVWELPYSVRKDLPALDLSMHVYSADPKQRFVVMKGDRHVEGDEVGQDLVLREIRQDGIVLDFKGQRFLFPRGGR